MGGQERLDLQKDLVVICLVLLGCTRASPTVSLSANPATVEHGQCATLTWSSMNADKVSIDQGKLAIYIHDRDNTTSAFVARAVGYQMYAEIVFSEY